MLRVISILMLSFLFIVSCATTSSDEGAGVSSEEDARQKELDEIEALLGVQRPPSDKDKKPAKEEDTLGLLKSEEVPVKGGTSLAAAAAAKPKEQASGQDVDRLQQQLAQKDAQISDLKQQVKNQNIQISQLESQKSSFMPVYSGTAADVPPGEYQMRYHEGLDLFHARNYSQAIEVFESLIASDANNSLSDNAQYWIGESHYALGQYKNAVIDFEKVFTFPKSNKNPDAQFKLGLCYVRLGDSAKASEEFQRLIDVYPESSYVGRAQDHLAGL